MAVADALKERVRIIIRCHALLLCVTSLRGPEVLTIGDEDGGQGLTMFLGTFAKEACRLGIGRGRSHHRVKGTKPLQMPEVMDAVIHLLLQLFPCHKTHGTFVSQ